MYIAYTVCIYIYIYAYIYIYIYVCVYIYIYKHTYACIATTIADHYVNVDVRDQRACKNDFACSYFELIDTSANMLASSLVLHSLSFAVEIQLHALFALNLPQALAASVAQRAHRRRESSQLYISSVWYAQSPY